MRSGMCSSSYQALKSASRPGGGVISENRMAGLDTGGTRELIDKARLAVLDADVQIVRQSDTLQAIPYINKVRKNMELKLRRLIASAESRFVEAGQPAKLQL